MTEHDSWAGLVETHTGAVFFLGDVAVKVRKPVRFSFVDLSSRAQRRRACQQEVRLNRRLSPDVYLGVGSLVIPGAEPEPAVMMRRLPERTRLAALVGAHAPRLQTAVDLLARHLAAFHATCATRDVGRARQLAELWRDATQTLAHHPALVESCDVDMIERHADAYLAGRAQLLDERVENGWMRDGHGDLLADDIFILDDGPRILDCLDFDDRLRCGDVLLDVAFLAMDLERLGAPELARLLVDRYGFYAGEKHPVSLEHFYIAYRAIVRAKVLALRSDQGAHDAAAEARKCAGLALEHLRAATVTLVLVGGLPGSGKSTLAAALATTPGWNRLSTDDIRRESQTGPAVYTDAARTAVYDEVLARAEAALAAGQSLVLDATWGTGLWRHKAQAVAERTHTTLVEICCVVPDDVANERLLHRREGSSDADEVVRKLLADSFEPWPRAQVVDGTEDEPAARAAHDVIRAAVRSAGAAGQPATVTNE